MCMVVYVAADAPLPLISWDPQAPAFHVKALDARDDPVRARFSKPHVYYVGSHEGCGCGFGYGQWDGEKPDDQRAAQASVARLADYVAAATRAAGALELYACWDGDQAAEPAHRLEMTPGDIGGRAFWFNERTFVVIESVT